MFGRIASVVERRAGLFALGWLVVAVALSVGAPSFQKVGTEGDVSFLPSSSPSVRAERMQRQLFPDSVPPNTAILVATHEPRLSAADTTYLSTVVADLDGYKTVAAVQSAETDARLASFLRSEDGAAELVIIGVDPKSHPSERREMIARLRARVERNVPGGLRLSVTGAEAFAADQGNAVGKSFGQTAIITLLLVLAILLAVYRSALTPLIPLVTIGMAFVVAQGLVALLADHGFNISSLAGTFMVIVAFGVGTDYCLFIVSRYREELGGGDSPSITRRRTMTVIGGVVAASGATVVAGFLSQTIGKFGVYRSMAPALAIAVVVTLLACLTLTPALLRLSGRHAFWPSSLDAVRQRDVTDSKRWEVAARLVRRRPAVVLLIGIVGLALPATGLLKYRQSYDVLSHLPRDSEARRGFDALSKHLPGGTLSPAYLVVASDDGILDDQRLAAVDRLTDALRAVPGIADVRSVTQPAGAGRAPGAGPVAVGAPHLTASMLREHPELTHQIATFLGSDARSTRLVVVPGGNPYSGRALSAFREIDDVAARTLAGGPLAGARLAVGGPTAASVDIEAVANSDLRLIGGVILATIFVVLALLLRSLVAPFYLLLTILLSLAATAGLAVIVFQGLLGEPGMSFALPIFLVVFLVALGADYNIFIMSRIREEADAGHEIHDAVGRGLVRTGPVITSAGLILAGTFGSLVLAPFSDLRQIGFGVAAGVLLDTFVVRTLLVPSATTLLGRWAFWPFPPAASAIRVNRRQVGWAGIAVAGFAVAILLLVSSGRASVITTVP